MRIKILFTLLLLVCMQSWIQAQSLYYNQQPRFLKANSVWCFGNYAGLNFNNGGPTSFKSNAPNSFFGGSSSTTSVADPVTGQLLFYTDGTRFYKANGQLMVHGSRLDTGLMSCIVPIIGQQNKYYVFSINIVDSIWKKVLTQHAGYMPFRLCYSIVDMSLDNGRGDVDPAYRNVLIEDDDPALCMLSVLGERCDDIWLVVCSYAENAFKAYHITTQGIDPNPVITYLDKNKFSVSRESSEMAISPDRKKIAFTILTPSGLPIIKQASIGNFNALTGEISNIITIGVDTPLIKPNIGVNNPCFSPDNSKLYLRINSNGVGYIYQYEVSIPDSTSITQSQKKIVSAPGTLKLYNDTIYVGGTDSPPSDTFLSRINRPNLSGIACQFQDNVIQLVSGTATSFRLFNAEVVLPMAHDTTIIPILEKTVCSNGNGINVDIQAQSTSGYNYYWNTGDTAKSIQVTNRGTYKVAYNDRVCHTNIESIEIEGSDVSTHITVNGFELGTTGGPFSTYQWLVAGKIIPGATQSKYIVQKNGAYQVIVANKDGCTDTSVVYDVTNVSVPNVQSLGNSIFVYPNPASKVVYVDAPLKINITLLTLDGRIIAHQDNTRPIFINSFPSSVYLFRITDEEGILLKTGKIIHCK